MMTNQLQLLRVQRFLPLFMTQFFGAFNDNLYKNALVILITYQLFTATKMNVEILITIAAGLFILPYFLFSALAGQLADKFDKSRLIRYTKLVEILLMAIVGIGFYFQDISLLLLVLFLLGIQATFFGPMKYSILPDHLLSDELIAGNALLEAGTYLAILLGTIVGGILATFKIGPLLVTIIAILIAIMGYVTSLAIPPAPSTVSHLKINFNIVSSTWHITKHSFKNRKISLSILGISWFWFVGATYLAQFPTYAKKILGVQPSVVTLLLICFTVGVGIGSLLCNRLMRGRIHATYVPYAALFMCVFGFDLVLASHHFSLKTSELISLSAFLSSLSSWRLLFDLTCLAISSGIYIVPLYTILQYDSEPSYRSRAVASNNIINALFMVVSALVSSLMLFLQFSVTDIFLLVAITNLFVAIYIFKRLPM